MKLRIPLFLIVTALLMLFISGCSGRTRGIEEARILSGEEKAELVKIALGTDEVKQLMENKEFYQVKIGWALIQWRDDGSDISEVGYFPYDYEDFRENFEKEISRGKEIYAAVIFEMGDPIDYGVNVSINPDTLQVVNIIKHPITPIR